MLVRNLIRRILNLRILPVQDVKERPSSGACILFITLNTQSLPVLDNLYALSELLQVLMYMLVSGTRRYHSKKIPNGVYRPLSYYRLV